MGTIEVSSKSGACVDALRQQVSQAALSLPDTRVELPMSYDKLLALVNELSKSKLWVSKSELCAKAKQTCTFHDDDEVTASMM